MKILLLMALMNIHNGDVSELSVVQPYDTWAQCVKALVDTGPQKPDKNGKVKVFECVKDGEKPTGREISDL